MALRWNAHGSGSAMVAAVDAGTAGRVGLCAGRDGSRRVALHSPYVVLGPWVAAARMTRPFAGAD